MSNEPSPTATPVGPPWSVDTLADLQAGIYPPDVAARLRAQVASDPEALAILAALDSTVDDLSLLPTLAMPERFVLRLDAAIAAESSARDAARQRQSAAGSSASGPAGDPHSFRPDGGQTVPTRSTGNPGPAEARRLSSVSGTPPAGPAHFGPPQFRPAQFGPGPVAPGPADPKVVPIGAARSKRNRWIGGLGVAAAVAIGATITISSLNSSSPGTGSAAPAPLGNGASLSSSLAGGGSPNALELTPGKFQDAFAHIKGSHTGPLTSGPTFASCMAANDIAGPDVLGVSEVTYRGRPASAVAVKIDATHARIVVVGLSCGVNGAQALLDQETVTR